MLSLVFNGASTIVRFQAKTSIAPVLKFFGHAFVAAVSFERGYTGTVNGQFEAEFAP